MNGVKRNMKSNEIKQYTPLLIELLKRDIKVKYRKSVLGVLWSVLNPLFMMIILSVVFSTLFKNNVENYPTYIFSGQLIYNFFSEATTSSMSAIVDNASLIKKIYVPKYLFVLARICSSMINLMATLSALFCVMLVLRIDLSYRLYEGVVALILLTLFSTGEGLVLSAIAVKFRDMMHLYSVFLTALMYLCPIIYEVLSVGDFRFQKKCEDRIKKMQESGTTVLFVSHSIEQVKKICNKIVWLDHGKVRMYGNTREVCEEYEKI